MSNFDTLNAQRARFVELRQYAIDCGFCGNFAEACRAELNVDFAVAGPENWLAAAQRVVAQAEAHLEALAEQDAEQASWEE